MIRYLFPLLFAAFLFGCATTSFVNLNGLTAQDVSRRISGESSSLKYFSSNGYGNFETKEGAYSASFRLSIDRPSVASVYLYGPFGMKVAQVRLTPDTLLVYNSLRNEVIVGKPTISNLREFLMIADDGESVTDILLDLVPPISHLDSPQVSTLPDGGDVRFVYTSGDTVEEYTIDGKYMRTAEYQKLVDGNVVVQIKYSDFAIVDNICIPKSVWFEDMGHSVSARLFYQDIAVNEKEDLELTVPADAKEIILN